MDKYLEKEKKKKGYTMWKVSKTNWSINFKDWLCVCKLEFHAFEHDGCWSLLFSLIPYEHASSQDSSWRSAIREGDG